MSIRQQTPKDIVGKVRVDLFKDEFDQLIWDKGYPVRWEQTTMCPCRNQNTAPKLGCTNCLGTGWVMINTMEIMKLIRVIIRIEDFKFSVFPDSLHEETSTLRGPAKRIIPCFIRANPRIIFIRATGNFASTGPRTAMKQKVESVVESIARRLKEGSVLRVVCIPYLRRFFEPIYVLYFLFQGKKIMETEDILGG